MPEEKNEINLNLNNERYKRKCGDCIHRDVLNTEEPCNLCYENEHLLGWHYYWEERSKK